MELLHKGNLLFSWGVKLMKKQNASQIPAVWIKFLPFPVLSNPDTQGTQRQPEVTARHAALAPFQVEITHNDLHNTVARKFH
jgi:hypothetical protein